MKKLAFLWLLFISTFILAQQNSSRNDELNRYKYEALQAEMRQLKATNETHINTEINHLKENIDIKISTLEDKLNIYLAGLLGLFTLCGFALNWFGRKAIKDRTEEIIKETAYNYATEQTKLVIASKVTDEFVAKLTREKAESEILRIINEFEQKGSHKINEFELQAKSAIDNITRPAEQSSALDETSTYEEITTSKNRSTLNELYNIALNSNNPIIQVELYKKIIAIDEQQTAAYNNIGVSFQNLNDFDNSIKYLTRGIEIDSNFALLYGNRANAFNQLEKLEEALEDANKAIELDSSFATAYAVKGNILTKQNKNQEADEILKKAISINPNSPVIYFNRGYLYDCIGEFEKAEQDYKKAESLGYERKASLYNNLAVLYRHKKQYEKAFVYLDKARIEDPNFLNTEGTMALIYADQGETEKFYSHLKMALDKGCPVWNYLSDKGFDNYRDSERLKNLLNAYQNK